MDDVGAPPALSTGGAVVAVLGIGAYTAVIGRRSTAASVWFAKKGDDGK
jgi:hypothetical protein